MISGEAKNNSSSTQKAQNYLQVNLKNPDVDIKGVQEKMRSPNVIGIDPLTDFLGF